MPARASTRPQGVLVGSRHTAESLWAALADPSLARQDPPRSPGRRHRPLRSDPAGQCAGRLEELAGRVGSQSQGDAADEDARGRGCRQDPRHPPRGTRTPSGPPRRSSGSPRPRARASCMVGKLIVSKGVDLLLACWPLVHAANPGARLLIVGFGEYDGGASAPLGVADRRGDRRRPRDRGARSRPGGGRGAPASNPRRLSRGAPGWVRGGSRARRRTASRSRVASSTRRSAAWCRPPTHWSFPAPSPRRSAWWRPRPRRPACSRSRPGTRAPPR